MIIYFEKFLCKKYAKNKQKANKFNGVFDNHISLNKEYIKTYFFV